jgi:hypothetical protein
MTIFNYLNIPEQWQQYYTKYPEGYTILEALLNWVKQTNDLTDNVNAWNTYLDDFKKSFDTDLQGTVEKTLTDWQNSGFLNIVINEALQTEIDTVKTTLTKLIYNVKDYGAKGDGTDDGPAIRAAIEAAVTNGGGTILIPDSSTYLINTLSGISNDRGDYAFILDNNIHIIANQGATLKLGDNMRTKAVNANGAGMFFAAGKDRVSVKGIKIDMNGLNNLVPVGATITGYAIHFSVCSNVEVEGNEIINSFGRNAILLDGRTSSTASGDKGRIANNVIRNGGTSLTGNTNQNDFSAIYCDYTNVVIKDNKVYHDSYSFAGCGGIEVHNDNIQVINNYIEKSTPAIYLSSDYSGQVLKNITVEDNVFENVTRGIYFFGYGDFDTVFVKHNKIKLYKNPNLTTITVGAGILQSIDAGGNFNYTLKIQNAVIEGNVFTENFTTYPTAGTAVGMNLSALFNVSIIDNIFNHISSAAISLKGNPYGVDNVNIMQNMVRDFGLNMSSSDHNGISLDFSGSSTTPAQSNFNASNIKITDNKIGLGDSTAQNGLTFYAFNFNWNDGSTIKALNVYYNEIQNIQTKRGAKMALVNISQHYFADSGYDILPSGLIVQWMKAYVTVAANTDFVVNLPMAFPTNVMSVQVSPIGISSVTASLNGATTSQITVRASAQNVTVYIIAIGY